MTKRFAYIKLHSHPINACIAQALVRNLPGMEMELVDVGELVRARKRLVLANMLHVFIEYGWEILLGRKAVRECFWRTAYIFRAIKALTSAVLSKDRYAFSIQNQSLFDGSKAGIPHYVYTDHTHLANLRYPDFDRRRLYSARWVELERSVYLNATLNFTRNRLAARSIVEDYSCPPDKVVCVFAGSNVGTDFEVNVRKYSSKRILFVGTEWERKGGPELVEAFKRVLEAHPTARLTIIGCSPEVDVPNCEVVGRVPLERLNDWYEGASVFCLPSKLEPYAIVFLEAAAHGLPVVATEMEGAADFVLHGETGYLVKLGDIESLAGVLSRMIADPEKCRTMGENGRRLVRQNFSWDKVGARLVENILASTRAGPMAQKGRLARR
jgi:glycosyltransferase involved in cell wall biosynthesis